jgi:hypothetical protein
VLECLQHNGGDFTKTSAETGISTVTLRKWWRDSPQKAAQDEAELARRLRRKLLESAVRLVESLDGTIENAPLNQRAAALGIVIDRFMKLDALFPQSNQQGQVIRFEYRYPDGSIHDAPPWAGDDSEREGTFQGGGLRAKVRQDGNGQDSDYRERAARGPLLVAGPYLPDDEPSLARSEDDAGERLRFDD